MISPFYTYFTTSTTKMKKWILPSNCVYSYAHTYVSEKQMLYRRKVYINGKNDAWYKNSSGLVEFVDERFALSGYMMFVRFNNALKWFNSRWRLLALLVRVVEYVPKKCYWYISSTFLLFVWTKEWSKLPLLYECMSDLLDLFIIYCFPLFAVPIALWFLQYSSFLHLRNSLPSFFLILKDFFLDFYAIKLSLGILACSWLETQFFNI